MNTFKRVLSLGAVGALFVASAFGQVNTLTQTTLSAAAAVNDGVVSVTSATGIVAPSVLTGVNGSILYVVSPGSKGEAMQVQSISGTKITVARGTKGTRAMAQTNGAIVLIGAPNYFYSADPAGACTTASTYVTPYVNILTGEQWLCSSVTLNWVPGWSNKSRAVQPTAAVASAAGAIVPSGPLFHVTGTAAITGFTLPVGFTGGEMCVVPDAIFTTTNAGNIAIASTAVVSKRLCFVYDSNAAKFYPSY